MRRAYAESGVDPQTVGLIEGHGTATVVGDSTEIDALHGVFGREGGSIALGSVKSMIGHTMAAAGMARSDQDCFGDLSSPAAPYLQCGARTSQAGRTAGFVSIPLRVRGCRSGRTADSWR